MIASFAVVLCALVLLLIYAYLSEPTYNLPDQKIIPVPGSKRCPVKDAYWSAQCDLRPAYEIYINVNMAFKNRSMAIKVAGLPDMGCKMQDCEFSEEILDDATFGIKCESVNCECDPDVYSTAFCSLIQSYGQNSKFGCPAWRGENMECGMASLQNKGYLKCNVNSCLQIKAK